MPILKNQKWELFCQGIVKGLTKKQAAINAGLSPKSAESAASRLAKNVKVKARIVELRQLVVKAGDMVLTSAQLEAQTEPVPFVRARVADRQYRMTVYQELLDNGRALQKARAKAYAGTAPGGETGLVTETNVKVLKTGKNKIEVVHIYATDTSLANLMLAVTKQAAIETGDWEEKQRPPVAPEVDLSHMTADEIAEELEILRDAERRIEAMRKAKGPAGLIEARVGSV